MSYQMKIRNYTTIVLQEDDYLAAFELSQKFANVENLFKGILPSNYSISLQAAMKELALRKFTQVDDEFMNIPDTKTLVVTGMCSAALVYLLYDAPKMPTQEDQKNMDTLVATYRYLFQK